MWPCSCRMASTAIAAEPYLAYAKPRFCPLKFIISRNSQSGPMELNRGIRMSSYVSRGIWLMKTSQRGPGVGPSHTNHETERKWDGWLCNFKIQVHAMQNLQQVLSALYKASPSLYNRVTCDPLEQAGLFLVSAPNKIKQGFSFRSVPSSICTFSF